MSVLLAAAVFATLADAAAYTFLVVPGYVAEVNPIAAVLPMIAALTLKGAVAVGMPGLAVLVNRSDHARRRRFAALIAVLVAGLTAGTLGFVSTLTSL